MKRLVLVGGFAAALAATTAFAQTSGTSGTTALGTVRLTKKVMADGKPLSAGTYQVRLTNDQPQPGPGQEPGGEQWVEFVKGGQVAGRELAVVISAEDIGKVAKGRRPAPNTALVELLKGGYYYRVWINRGGKNFIINMPPAT